MSEGPATFRVITDEKPHQLAIWDYSIRVPIGKKTTFRNEFPNWKIDANEALSKLPVPVKLRLTDCYEVLIGPKAGSIEIRWNIVTLAELDREDVGEIIGKFDARLRTVTDPNHSPSGRILGLVE